MKSPWTIKSTKLVYNNPWISVREDQVITPSGTDGIYGVVHLKGYALGIVALDAEQNIYLVGQYRYPLEKYSWELPEGGGDLKAPPLESAKRELREETGLIAKEWEYLCKYHPSNSITDEVGFLYLATDLVQGEMDLDETEDIKVKKLPFVEALRMVEREEITDLISITGIYAVARKLGV